jgi:hypothetical protein
VGNNYGTLTRPLTAAAICARDVTVTYRSTTVDVPVGQQGNLQVGCAPGESVIGGGYINYYNNTFVITRAAPITENGVSQWVVTATNRAALTRPFTATAICADNLPVVYRSSTLGVPAGNQITAVATCAAGEALIGGGFVNTQNDGGQDFVSATSPYTDKFGRTSWQATANNAGPLPQQITATAVCTSGFDDGSGSGSGSDDGSGSGS